MHGNCAGILRCVRESSRAVMCFYVAARRGAGSVGLAGDRPAHAGLMPSEATDTSEGGLWRTPFSFISINKVAFLNKRPHSLFLPYPSLHQCSPCFWISTSHSFPPNLSLGQESWFFFFFLFAHVLIKGANVCWAGTAADINLCDFNTQVTESLPPSFLWSERCSCLQSRSHYQPHQNLGPADFPGGPVLMNPPCNTGDAGSIPVWGTMIPHSSKQLNPCAITTEPTCCNWRIHAPQQKISHETVKIPHAATKTWHSQISK